MLRDPFVQYLPAGNLLRYVPGVAKLLQTPGEKFAYLRKRVGFSQSSMAKAMLPVHCSDQAISDFESGRSERMHPERWKRAARLLELSTEFLTHAVFDERPVSEKVFGDVVEGHRDEVRRRAEQATLRRDLLGIDVTKLDETLLEIMLTRLLIEHDRRQRKTLFREEVNVLDQHALTEADAKRLIQSVAKQRKSRG